MLSCYRISSITKVPKEEILYNISSSGTFIVIIVPDGIHVPTGKKYNEIIYCIFCYEEQICVDHATVFNTKTGPYYAI